MGSIQLKDVRKAFGAVSIINGVNLNIENGEFAVFVGPSGCGKSTLLRLIAGLEDVTSGEVLIDAKNMTNVGPAQRGLAMVFQSYALYPHMSVRGNIAFALKMAGQKAEVIEQKVRKAAATLKTTIIYVTHDQVEAMTMADKIVVLDRGSVAQVGSPLELYNRPNGLFVAGFIGSPPMNLIKGAPATKRGAETIGIRPEHADISTTAGEWPAKVRLAEHLGSDTFVHAEADGMGPLTLRLEGEAPLTPGQSIFVTPREAHLHRFDKDGKRIA